MTSLTFTRRTSVIEKGNVTDKIRAFIAGHVGFDVDCVTVDSHFRDDLGMDLLDVVELMILIEDQFTDVEITDHEPEIEFVEDLIRHIEIVDDASGEIP